MENFTKAQSKHINALTNEFISMGDMRKNHGFCNSNTLNCLRLQGLVELMSTSTPNSFVAVRDVHYKLTELGMTYKA